MLTLIPWLFRLLMLANEVAGHNTKITTHCIRFSFGGLLYLFHFVGDLNILCDPNDDNDFQIYIHPFKHYTNIQIKYAYRHMSLK